MYFYATTLGHNRKHDLPTSVMSRLSDVSMLAKVSAVWVCASKKAPLSMWVFGFGPDLVVPGASDELLVRARGVIASLDGNFGLRDVGELDVVAPLMRLGNPAGNPDEIAGECVKVIMDQANEIRGGSADVVARATEALEPETVAGYHIISVVVAHSGSPIDHSQIAKRDEMVARTQELGGIALCAVSEPIIIQPESAGQSRFVLTLSVKAPSKSVHYRSLSLVQAAIAGFVTDGSLPADARIDTNFTAGIEWFELEGGTAGFESIEDATLGMPTLYAGMRNILSESFMPKDEFRARLVGPAVRDQTPGRNDVCFCGSERKYKHCHGA